MSLTCGLTSNALLQLGNLIGACKSLCVVVVSFYELFMNTIFCWSLEKEGRKARSMDIGHVNLQTASKKS